MINKKQFFLFIIILGSFMDAYPIFPSDYRPLTLAMFLFIFPISFIKIIRANLDEFKIIVFLFFTYILSLSFFYSLFYFSEFTGFFDSLITISLAILTYTTFIIIFKYFNYTKKDFDLIFKVLSNFLLVLAIIEILSIYGIFPSSIKVILNNIFTLSYSSRFLLINKESSWASLTLLYVLSYFIYKDNKIKSFLTYFIILMSFSMTGILLSTILVIFYLFRKKIFYKIFFYTFIVFFIFLIFMKYYEQFFNFLGIENQYTIIRISKWIEIFKNDTQNIFKSILVADGGSTYIRVLYPLIAFLEGIKSIIGLGAGNFGLIASNYVKTYNLNTDIPLIQSLVDGNYTSIGNFYSKIVFESGLFGIGIIVYILKYIISIAKKIDYSFLVFPIILVFFQFSSYIYLPFIMTLSILNFLNSKEGVD
jgi:hypothetical protein